MAVSVFPSSSASASGEVTTYYGITAAGTYTVDLPAGIYDLTSTSEVTVGGQSVNGTLDLAVFAAGISTLETPSAGVQWTQQSPLFDGRQINGIAYGNELYVAVGYWYDGGWKGRITTSPDGTTWTARTSGFGSSYINDATYSSGLFVAVGDGGKLETSPDGITWTGQAPGFGQYTEIDCAASGGGLFLAGSNDGKLATSKTFAEGGIRLSITPKTPSVILP